MLDQRHPGMLWLKENGSIFLSHGVVQMYLDSPGLVGYPAQHPASIGDPLAGICQPGREQRRVKGKHPFLWMWQGSCTRHFCSPPIGQDLSHSLTKPPRKLGNTVCS